MLDVFFLSYNEPFADEKFQKLLLKAPHARRVHGVEGFVNAHRQCAKESLTYNFYVVDADAQLVDDFDFEFTPSKFKEFWPTVPESECLCVWSSINPINDLIYGYGGVKLIPKIPLLRQDKDTVDFTTGFGLPVKIFDKISNITAFNYDEFNTWRSAFRECAKLSAKVINIEVKTDISSDELLKMLEDNKQRLETWCTIGAKRKFGEVAIAGAIMGKDFGAANAHDPEKLKLINDYEWIKNEFDRFFRKSGD